MTDTRLVKTAGEHWMCAQLSRRGWAAALTRDGVERTDILAVKTDESRRMIEVQVKSASMDAAKPNRASWPLGKKAQLPSATEQEWFVRVALPNDADVEPRGFVVPRNVVAATAWVAHEHWRTDPAAVPETRPSIVRVSPSIYGSDMNRWDPLDGDTSSADVMLAPAMREWALLDRVGLPPHHPWRANLPEW